MSDQPTPETPEIVDEAQNAGEPAENTATVSEPAKVMREIYETSVEELSQALSPDLRAELERLALPFDEDDVPSGPELRVAQAQLVGWLEGLFHGIQATLFAQQNAARQQLEQIQQPQALPPGRGGPQPQGGGVYL